MDDTTTVIPKTKICNNCNNEFPATDEFFFWRTYPSGNRGLTSLCKTCRVRQTSEWKDKNGGGTYANRRVKNLCPNCGKPRRSSEYIKCADCYARDMEYRREYVARCRDEGRCIRCEKPAAKRRCHCSSCLEISRRRTTIRATQAKETGICTTCKRRPAKLPKSSCSKCTEMRKRAYLKAKDIVFSAYGNSCQCCGETEKHFLTIDHVNSDGAAERKSGVRNIFITL